MSDDGELFDSDVELVESQVCDAPHRSPEAAVKRRCVDAEPSSSCEERSPPPLAFNFPTDDHSSTDRQDLKPPRAQDQHGKSKSHERDGRKSRKRRKRNSKSVNGSVNKLEDNKWSEPVGQARSKPIPSTNGKRKKKRSKKERRKCGDELSVKIAPAEVSVSGTESNGRLKGEKSPSDECKSPTVDSVEHSSFSKGIHLSELAADDSLIEIDDDLDEEYFEAELFEDVELISVDEVCGVSNDYTPEEDLPTYYPALMGCRSVEEFHCLNRIEEGTYGVVYRAVEKRTGQIVALKRLKMEKEREGFPITSLREVNMLLKAGRHVNVVNVQEIVVGSNMDKIYLVMEYIEHDMKSLMECMKQPFLVGEVKTLMKQLLSGVFHLHDNWILHRDLKSSNLLLTHDGILKIGDFGLSREYGSPLRAYTPIVVTLWYRAPELLLGAKKYTTAIDLWSVGCLFSEFLTLKPLFPAKNEIDEIGRIFKLLGTPNETVWPDLKELPAAKKFEFPQQSHSTLRKMFGATLSDTGYDLLTKLLTYDPKRRISAADGLEHDWFKEEPRPVHPSQFPSWPAKSDMHSSSAWAKDPKPPSGGQMYKETAEADRDLMASLKIRPHQSRTAGFMLKFDALKF